MRQLLQNAKFVTSRDIKGRNFRVNRANRELALNPIIQLHN